MVDLIGIHYKFSPRLLAIIRTAPPVPGTARRQERGLHAKAIKKDDLEGAVVGRDAPGSEFALGRQKLNLDASHYAIAQKMKHYHSVDFGPKCKWRAHHCFDHSILSPGLVLCIGANWMHELASKKSEENILSEGEQRALWSWLILCDDRKSEVLTCWNRNLICNFRYCDLTPRRSRSPKKQDGYRVDAR